MARKAKRKRGAVHYKGLGPRWKETFIPLAQQYNDYTADYHNLSILELQTKYRNLTHDQIRLRKSPLDLNWDITKPSPINPIYSIKIHRELIAQRKVVIKRLINKLKTEY